MQIAGIAVLCGLTIALHAADVTPLIQDKFVPSPESGQTLGGVLGRRLKVNLEGRLLKLDEAGVLDPFVKRDPKSRWAGEHAGKFLEAASNTWQYSGDERIKALLDRAARRLFAAQSPDGYLGTYSDDARWTSWDVWVHKYDLIGLLAYYQTTRDPKALNAARKIGDLLCSTFGDTPGKRDIITAGDHVGMAATSVLEPVVELYRVTGDRRYLDFAHYLVRSYDQPNGPKIIRTLLATGSVYKTANAKAYEMMSNITSLLDLYRFDGNPEYLKTAQTAWDDIVARRRYITGTVSAGEHFLDDFELPAGGDAHVGEGCATFSWLQLNYELLRLSGEAKYAEELERTVYNALLGGQHPELGTMCYFTPLNGRKPYDRNITCCGSSLPRGIAMIPRITSGSLDGGAAIVLYTPGTLTIPVAGQTLKVRSETNYPDEGHVVLTLDPQREAEFALLLRVPQWAAGYRASVAGARYDGTPGQWLRIRRRWKRGDRLSIDMSLPVRALPGGKNYPNQIALQRGPQVLALDAEANPRIPILTAVGLASQPATLRAVRPQSYSAAGFTASRSKDGVLATRPEELVLVPFMDARVMRVWLPGPELWQGRTSSVFAFGSESASRKGDGDGLISDERPDTFRRTFDWTKPTEDWYAVESAEPVRFTRVVYRHGKSDDRGGWFDTSAGKPRIQVRRTVAGEWETIATLDSYPETTPADNPNLKPGEPFEVKLREPVTAVALRIAATPASGKRPLQAYSSCAELEAYEK